MARTGNPHPVAGAALAENRHGYCSPSGPRMARRAVVQCVAFADPRIVAWQARGARGVPDVVSGLREPRLAAGETGPRDLPVGPGRGRRPAYRVRASRRDAAGGPACIPARIRYPVPGGYRPAGRTRPDPANDAGL